LNDHLQVFQWHEDTFDILDGGVFLATARDCPNQAFRVGKNAYDLQFHIEIIDDAIRQWTQKYFKEDDHNAQKKAQAMIKEFQSNQQRFIVQSNKIYEFFFNIIENK